MCEVSLYNWHIKFIPKKYLKRTLDNKVMQLYCFTKEISQINRCPVLQKVTSLSWTNRAGQESDCSKMDTAEELKGQQNGGWTRSQTKEYQSAFV